MDRLAHLEIIFPRHISIYMVLGSAVDECSLALGRRLGIIPVVRSWPLPFFHLDQIRCRKGEGSALDEGHQCHRPEGHEQEYISSDRYIQQRCAEEERMGKGWP